MQASLLRRASTKRQRSFPKRSRHTLTNLVPAGTALGYLFSYCFSFVVAVPTVSGNLIHGNSSATFLPWLNRNTSRRIVQHFLYLLSQVGHVCTRTSRIQHCHWRLMNHVHVLFSNVPPQYKSKLARCLIFFFFINSQVFFFFFFFLIGFFSLLYLFLSCRGNLPGNLRLCSPNTSSRTKQARTSAPFYYFFTNVKRQSWPLRRRPLWTLQKVNTPLCSMEEYLVTEATEHEQYKGKK